MGLKAEFQEHGIGIQYLFDFLLSHSMTEGVM